MPVLLDKPMPLAGVDDQVGGKEGSREEPGGVSGLSWSQADTGHKVHLTPSTRMSLKLECEAESSCLLRFKK